MRCRHTQINQPIERLPINQRLQPVTHHDIGRRLARTVVHHAQRMDRPGSHLVAHMGGKGDRGLPANPSHIEIHRHKGRIIHHNPHFFHGSDQKIPVPLAPQDRTEQPHHGRPANRRPQIEPRPVAGDPHVDIATERRVPQMHRRRPLFARRRGLNRRHHAFRARFHDHLCLFVFCHLCPAQ